MLLDLALSHCATLPEPALEEASEKPRQPVRERWRSPAEQRLQAGIAGAKARTTRAETGEASLGEKLNRLFVPFQVDPPTAVPQPPAHSSKLG